MDQVHNITESKIKRIVHRHYWVRSLLGAFFLFAAGVGIIVALGVAQKIGWLSSGGHGPAGAANSKDVTYTCSMDPQIKQPMPGRCPICGMELVPASSVSEKNDPLAVHIDPAARRVANIQTTPVEWSKLQRPIQTIGSIRFDESRLATISAYVDGRIEKMFASYTGVRVKKGNHLVVLYAPELFAAQVEYLQSQETLKAMGTQSGKFELKSFRQLVVNSRHKLVELGMTEDQVQTLDKTKKPISRLTIYSPISGTVIERKVAEGDYVKTGQPIYKIADLNMVWLMLELYPEDASYIRHAQKVKAVAQSLPGEEFDGRVAFIDPVVNPKTRTISVRVEIPNKQGKLKPGDYASATISVPLSAKGKVYDAELAGKWISPMHPQIIEEKAGKCPICGMDLVPASEYGYSPTPIPPPKGLVVDRSAVLHSGKHDVVYVETEPGRFEIRPVTLGPVLNDKVVVLKGLEEGEMVAASGNFLIDSQMQLEGKPSLIDPVKAIDAHGRGPMHLKHFHVEKMGGAIGKQLEQMYAAYFAVQKTLAADKTVSAVQVKALATPVKALLNEDKFPRKYRHYLEVIAEHAPELDHTDLKIARRHFEDVSVAVIKMAARVRSDDAKHTFMHYHCRMVDSKRGNWLQAGGKLANPFHGAAMLRCGDAVHELPPTGRPQAAGKGEHKH